MEQFNNNFDRELAWDDEIQQDAEFVLLPDGLYQFTVESFDRERHTPNPQNPGKLPACNKAVIHIKIVANEGETTIRHNLFMYSTMEGMISAFFGAIGQKRKGEPLRMNWGAIVGATGVCKVGTREYNGNKYNEVKSMIYKEDVDFSKVLNANVQAQQPMQNYAQQQYQQPVTPQQMPFNTNYSNGTF